MVSAWVETDPKKTKKSTITKAIPAFFFISASVYLEKYDVHENL
jgi:hypothetical protein